jgi:hypothetical protein
MIALLLAVSIFMQRPGALQPGSGIVTGTIKVEGGASAAGIRVGAVDVDDPTASSFLSVTETDAAGRFRLINGPAGRYYIVAGRLTSLHFYPRGNTSAEAMEILVEPARTRADVNFTVATGSARPSQPAVSAGLNSMSNEEFAAYSAISKESNPERKIKLLVDFERNFPRSRALPRLYTDLMNVHVIRKDSRNAVLYGEKLIAINPNDVPALLQVSRNYTILETEPRKALEYAEKAVSITTRMKTQSPPSTMGETPWRTYATSLDGGARANLDWVKKTAAWRQQQFQALVAPRRAR